MENKKKPIKTKIGEIKNLPTVVMGQAGYLFAWAAKTHYKRSK